MFQEAYLTQQCLHPPIFEKFCLDGISNVFLCESTQKQCLLIVDTLLFLVEDSLYTQWNHYGTYCFVPAEDDIIAMLDALRRGNAKWKTYLFPYENPGRPLDVCSYPLHNINSKLYIGDGGTF